MARAFIADRMGSRASRVPAWRRGGAALSAVLLAGACACGLVGCYPSDFFKEIVIDPNAIVEDTDNPNATKFNNPDAEEGSYELSALKLDEDAEPTDRVENMVVWTSKEPSYPSASAHHSIFDLNPRIIGIEASDGVRVVAANEDSVDTVDASVNDDDMESSESKVQGAGGKQEEESDDTSKAESKKKEGESSDASGDDGSSSGKGSSSKEGSGGSSKIDDAKGAGTSDEEGSGDGGAGDGSDSGSGSGEGGSSDDDSKNGSREIVGGGYGKNVQPVYNPNSQKAKIQKADHVAAMGQAAVMVQAIGGEGALCAMDEDTYYGRDGKIDATWESSFKDVFSKELAENFEKSALLWSGSGTSSEDIKDFDDLLEAVGADGVILYLGEYGGQGQYFTEEQMEKLETASIQLVPVDFSTVQGMLDAARVVGEILSESDELAEGWNTEQMASDYVNAVDSIVEAVADAHGGSLEGSTATSYSASAGGASTTLKTAYSSCPVDCNNLAGTWVTAVVADAYDGSIQYDSTYSGCSFDVSNGIVFTHTGCDKSPLSFWLQDAGVQDRSSAGGSISSKLCWYPLIPVRYKKAASYQSFAYSSSSPFGQMDTEEYEDYLTGSSNPRTWVSNVQSNAMANMRMGVGSKYTPYLIACAYGSYSVGDVKDALCDAMKNRNSLYYAYGLPDPVADKSTETYMGIEEETGSTGNAFTRYGLQPQDVVVENPIGLLGSWTEGSVECVLESVWAAELYSTRPNSSSSYSPVTDMSSFSCEVAGVSCDSLQETANAFYTAFYRYDLSSKEYSQVVTEERGDK